VLPFFQWSQRLTFNPSRLSPLASPPRAIAPAAGLGAALLRPYTLSSHVQRATFNLSTPHASRPLASPPSRHCSRCRSGRSAAAPLHVVVPRSTCNVQPFNPSRLSPLASPPSRHCSRCRSGRSAAAPLHVVVPRSACNVQPSTPHASRPSPRPLAPLLPLPVWAQRCCAPTRCRPTFSVQRSTFNPSRLSPPRPSLLASRLSLHPALRFTGQVAWYGASGPTYCRHSSRVRLRGRRAAGLGDQGPSGATTTPALCHPHSR
jgi:hypothetical protein